MSEIMALWRHTLRRSTTAYWQLLFAVAVLSALLSVPLGFGPALHATRAADLLSVGIAILAGAYLFGAAGAAVGEAARGDPPSDYFTRAGRYFGRTLGLIGAAGLAWTAFSIVMAIAFIFTGGFGTLMHLGTPYHVQVLSTAHAVTRVDDMVGDVVLLLVLPFFFALLADVYVGDASVGDALSRAGREAYAKSHLGHWSIALLAGILVDGVQAGLSRLGTVGHLAAIVIGAALSWALLALVFSVWQVHQGVPKVAGHGPALGS